MYKISKPLTVSLIVFSLGLVVAFVGDYYESINKQEEAKAHFEILAHRAVNQLEKSINLYQYGLRGARGAIISAGKDEITRNKFHNYSESRDLAAEFPGVRGFGFLRRIKPEDEAIFLKAARSDGMPGFNIKQFSAHDSDLFVAQYIEPEATNSEALGFDAASEKIRLKALQQAIASNHAVMTHPLTLPQAQHHSDSGMLIMLPIYTPGMPITSSALRWKAAYGIAYAPIVINEVLAGFDYHQGQIEISIADIGEDQVPVTFFSSSGWNAPAAEGISARKILHIFGREWQLDSKATPAMMNQLANSTDRIFLQSGLTISVLLSAIVCLVLVQLQRRRETFLKAAELLAIIDSADEAIIGKDLNGKVTSWNAGAERLFGYSRDEAVGKSFFSLIVPDELQAQDEWIIDSIRRGEAVLQLEATRKRKDGSILIASVSVTPIRNNAGVVVGAAKLIRDITETAQAKQEIIRLNASLESQVAQRTTQLQSMVLIAENARDQSDDLYNQAPCGYHSLDADGSILRINDTELAWLGYSRDEVISQHITEFMTPSTIEKFKAHFPKFMQDGYIGDMEVEYLRKDGSIFTGLMSAKTMHDAHGKFQETRSIMQDYSNIHDQQENLTRILSASPMAVSVTRLSDHRIIFLNNAFTQLVQKSEAEARGMDVSLNYHDQAVFNDIRLQLHHGEPVLNRLVELCLPDQPQVPHVWAISSYMLIDYAGEQAVLAWLLDVTQLHHARTNAEEASKNKSEFLANMSHEIRTPLNAVLGMSYLLSKRALDAESIIMVKKIEGSGRNLLGIINNILDFSKIEARMLKIEASPFRLTEMLEYLSAIMSSAVQNKLIEPLIMPLPKGIDCVIGDGLRLTQVLTNLVANAIKFTDHGIVRIQIEQIDPSESLDSVRLRFAVTDTGIGIHADKQIEIFSAFSQADTSTTRNFGGTGLGLTISSRLVELMGGELQVESTPQLGSTFSFEISLLRDQEAQFETTDIFHLNVLVVDDHADARSVLVEAAQSIGWSVDQSKSGDAAIKSVQLSAKPYDVILMDWRMPGMNGLEAASKIRDIENAHQHAIILMVTAYDQSLLQHENSIHLADQILSKPVTASTLYDAVQMAIRKRNPINHQLVSASLTSRLLGQSILVVDDSAINLDVAEHILLGEGAEVTLAENGERALEILRAQPSKYDLVFMDMQMPVMDGYEATRQIRLQPELFGLPVIALTAGAFTEQRKRAEDAGVDDFVAKPFEVNNLIHTILKHTRFNAAATLVHADQSQPLLPAQHDVVLDQERALKIWGDVETYGKYLHKFLSAHENSVEAIIAADLKSAAQLAHKLKGAAAQLNIEQVAALAADAEIALEDGHIPIKILEALQAAMDRAQHAILDLAPRPSSLAVEPEIHKLPDDPSALRAQLATLLEFLERNESAAVESAIDHMASTVPYVTLNSLREAVAAYDFRLAEEIVKKLLLSLIINKV